MTQERDSYHVSLKVTPIRWILWTFGGPQPLTDIHGPNLPKTDFQPFDPAGAQKVSTSIKLVRTEEGGDGWRAFMDMNKILMIQRNCSEMLPKSKT